MLARTKTRPWLQRGNAHSYGWLRRPDHDIPGQWAWETPAGKIIRTPRNRAVWLVGVVDQGGAIHLGDSAK